MFFSNHFPKKAEGYQFPGKIKMIFKDFGWPTNQCPETLTATACHVNLDLELKLLPPFGSPPKTNHNKTLFCWSKSNVEG